LCQTREWVEANAPWRDCRHFALWRELLRLLLLDDMVARCRRKRCQGYQHVHGKRCGREPRDQSGEHEQAAGELDDANGWPHDLRRRDADLRKPTCPLRVCIEELLDALRREDHAYQRRE
jgi:hypothetical protein